MPSVEQLRSRLLKKLSELFQLHQPDLDFGFYRIMHAKAKEVQEFIDNDLLKVVTDAFGDVDEARKAELQAAYEKAIQTAKDFCAPNPDETEPVKKAKAALDAVKDTASAEADVYDHLYRFFERYYDDGDFISRRYYTRETSGKAAPFAVPYNGEEVKLVWANMDQYYIKTSEYFSNYTFDLRQAKEVRALREQSQIDILLGAEDETPLKVHFRVVEATEGEHGNVKASEANKRFFILHAENPLTLTETSELVVNFEYRPDPGKTGQENTWRDKRNAEAVETILERLHALAAAGGEHEKKVKEYLRLFKVPAPTENDKKRPVLAKYVNQYTARNTMDYFIHKDLGGFLRRELDFYIKNEVMRLDDIESAEVPTVESYLAKLKVLRKIAGKLIDFLAQLENFQKKLWLKKKFIIETNYCITLDRVPEELYAEVVACDAQCEEWIKLFAIDGIQADLHSPGFSRPLTVEFLKANNKLVLDTRFFDESFKARLVTSIENFDEQCDGMLLNLENFQALSLFQERYCAQVDCIYIDPPYNTDASSILYKNGYKNSSWISLTYDRLMMARCLLNKTGILCAAIDDEQVSELRHLLKEIFPKEIGVAPVRSNPQSRKSKTTLSPAHEYALFYGISSLSIPKSLELTDKRLARYPKEDAKGRFSWMSFIRTGTNDLRSDRPKMFYPIFVNNANEMRIPKMRWSEDEGQYGSYIIEDELHDDEVAVYPSSSSNGSIIEKRWHRGFERVLEEPDEYRVRRNADGTPSIDFKTRIDETSTPITWWDKKEYASANYGAAELKALFGNKPFDFPKAVTLVKDCIRACTNSGDALICDYFAGSGTTGHAVISLNREEGGRRKFILVEMGDYFDTVLRPRISKVFYSDDWKDGKPISRETGISHCYKYSRFESYEDTLNNLRLAHNPQRQKAVAANPSLKEDYMLRYLLDVETRGSQSLLNIDAFADPTAYTMEVKKPGTDEYATRAVDLIETFNYLIGLRVLHTSVPQTFKAKFKRISDPELPEDQHTKLTVDGRIRQDPDGPWWFRKVEGWVPKDPVNPNNGHREKVLIVWRKLTGDIEQDNLMLDEWFQKNRISTRDFEFDTIYVNGSNNLPNLKLDDENWKVRLIEEEFMKRMWNGENA